MRSVIFREPHHVAARELNLLVSEDWYFGVECANCATFLALFEDWSGGRESVCFYGDGLLTVDCQHCGRSHIYRGHQIRQTQRPAQSGAV